MYFCLHSFAQQRVVFIRALMRQLTYLCCIAKSQQVHCKSDTRLSFPDTKVFVCHLQPSLFDETCQNARLSGNDSVCVISCFDFSFIKRLLPLPTMAKSFTAPESMCKIGVCLFN